MFQSVIIGGGYGTGAELKEFFLEYGPMGGLLGMMIAMVMAMVMVMAKMRYSSANGHDCGFLSLPVRVMHLSSQESQT